MFTLTLIPSITVTPAEDTTPAVSSTAPPSPHPLSPITNLNTPLRLSRRHSTAAVLPVPPLAAAHDDRVSLAQRGMPVGSFKLNCVESIGGLSPPRLGAQSITGAAAPSAASAHSVGKVFSWTVPGGSAALSNSTGTSSPRSQSRPRHTRAKSLNSLADFGIPPPNQISPPPEASSRRSRYRSLGMDMNMSLGETKFSIDLAVLESTPSPSEQGFSFSFARRS